MEDSTLGEREYCASEVMLASSGGKEVCRSAEGAAEGLRRFELGGLREVDIEGRFLGRCSDWRGGDDCFGGEAIVVVRKCGGGNSEVVRFALKKSVER